MKIKTCPFCEDAAREVMSEFGEQKLVTITRNGEERDVLVYWDVHATCEPEAIEAFWAEVAREGKLS
jgi:hypothetical protein